MGCDIHAFLERKNNGKWIFVKELDFNRNYLFFTILANVRSSPSSIIKIIDFPRGIPSDISKKTKHQLDIWDSDGHSLSFFTKEDLDSYDWDSDIVYFDILNQKQYYQYLNEKKYENSTYNEYSKEHNLISEEKMKELLINGIKDDDVSCEILVKVKILEHIENSYTILKNEITSENVRMVYWFDN